MFDLNQHVQQRCVILTGPGGDGGGVGAGGDMEGLEAKCPNCTNQ